MRSGELISTSAVAMFVASGILQTLQIRSKVWMSGSCGCLTSGSTMKRTASMSPSTTRLAIWTSPPCGPAVTRSTSSPTLSRSRSPVAPVAMMSYSCRRLRLNVANATRSAFLPSWAMMARRGRSRFEANFTCESILTHYFESIERWLQKYDGIFESVAHPNSTPGPPRLFRDRITHSGARIPPGTGVLQKIRQQLVAMLGQDGLGMELHAGEWMLPVPQSHDRAILGPGGDLEVGRQGGAFHDQRVIAGGGKRAG